MICFLLILLLIFCSFSITDLETRQKVVTQIKYATKVVWLTAFGTVYFSSAITHMVSDIHILVFILLFIAIGVPCWILLGKILTFLSNLTSNIFDNIDNQNVKYITQVVLIIIMSMILLYYATLALP